MFNLNLEIKMEKNNLLHSEEKTVLSAEELLEVKGGMAEQDQEQVIIVNCNVANSGHIDK